tara:strand:- start:92 stop:247 length:156 start_codon:yes stop_codon:yes gene_type:complete
MEMTDGAWDLARQIGKTQERNRIIRLLMKKLKEDSQLTIGDVLEIIAKDKK